MTHWLTDFTRFRWAPLAVLAFVALWPTVGPAEAVLSLGALTGFAILLAGRFREGTSLISREAWALSTALFFCYWLPEFFSAFDAVDRGRAWHEVLVDLRYLPFLWLVAMAVAYRRGRRWVLTGIGVIAIIWALDAMLQATTGISLGGVNSSDRLSGVFGADNLKLGLVLASLAPFALDLVARRFDGPGWVLCALLLGTVILLAGSRASWVTFGLVLLISGWRRFGPLRLGLIMAAGVLVAAVVAMNYSTQFESRIARSGMVLSGDVQGVNDALAGRLDIWRVAGHIIADHPINGVGVRGFRDVYAQYAGADDFWLSNGQAGALHAHQLVLEILAETGFLGLLFWIMGAALALRAWRWALPPLRTRGFPAALALVVTLFPFNTHLAFYSTFWGGMTILLVGLYAGCLFAIEGDEVRPDA